ncbi:MAG: carboxy terminal-processing peptidase [Ginsengibacter sp.]
MSKKFIPVLLILILAGLFITYGVNGKGERKDNNPEDKYQKILLNVGIVLEQGHYSPKKIDDEFSKEVLERYIKSLDPDKNIFLHSDINSFKKFEKVIDDEIHGAPIKSFYTIIETYKKRLDETNAISTEILSKPINFKLNEFYEPDGDKKKFATNAEIRYDYNRKRIKYIVLRRYSDLLDQREKNKKDSTYKSDSELQEEAITAVSKQIARYYETLTNHNTTDDLFSTFVNAITGTMDPHTNYFAPVDKRTFDEMLSGSFYGIGAQLKEEDGTIKVVSLITGMPAWKSGEMDPEDEIIKIAQGNEPAVDVTGYALPDAVKLIRGEKGTEVRLTLRKANGVVKEVSILRDKISLEETYAKSAIINGEHKIGYIYLPEFYADFNDPNGRRSGTDVKIEVQKLMDANVEGMVIDLRGNGGGSLADVVEMVGLFVKAGPVVQVKGRGEKAIVLDDRSQNVLYKGPLTVLVDELSASASEIFAAAIQDYHRGIVLGSSSTYGKGTVQRSISLEPQAENRLFSRPAQGLGDVKLTFRKFYRINGGATQLRGVVPDIIIPDRLENAKFREKDNPYSLGWDEIPKAKYTTWGGGNDFNSIIKQANQNVSSDANFSGIKEIVNQLEKFRNEPIPLNVEKYQALQKQIEEFSKQMDNYYKLKTGLNIRANESDSLAAGGDTIKLKALNQFIKAVSNDIYVDKAVKVTKRMITQSSIARIED